jgi:hypothetical protein
LFSSPGTLCTFGFFYASFINFGNEVLWADASIATKTNLSQTVGVAWLIGSVGFQILAVRSTIGFFHVVTSAQNALRAHANHVTEVAAKRQSDPAKKDAAEIEAFSKMFEAADHNGVIDPEELHQQLLNMGCIIPTAALVYHCQQIRKQDKKHHIDTRSFLHYLKHLPAPTSAHELEFAVRQSILSPG